MKTSKTNLSVVVFSILMFAFLSGCAGGGISPNYDKYKNVLQNQMREMYNVLFGGHASDFLEQYVDPTYIKNMGGVDAALREFGNTRQQALMEALRAAQNMTPAYEEKSNEMIYSSMAFPQPLAFKMINGKWYLESDWFKQ